MALLPAYILNELVNDRYDPVERLHDQYFGLGLPNDDVYRYPTAVSGCLRPFKNFMTAERNDVGVYDEKDQFQINLDVQQFKPEEIKVKVEKDNIIVEGVHEERKDKHGFISRKFTRRYKVPPNTNLEAIKSKLSSDGVLSIAAPKKAIEGPKHREIPIHFSSKPAIQQKPKIEIDVESKKSNGEVSK